MKGKRPLVFLLAIGLALSFVATPAAAAHDDCEVAQSIDQAGDFDIDADQDVNQDNDADVDIDANIDDDLSDDDSTGNLVQAVDIDQNNLNSQSVSQSQGATNNVNDCVDN